MFVCLSPANSFLCRCELIINIRVSEVVGYVVLRKGREGAKVEKSKQYKFYRFDQLFIKADFFH